MDNTQYWVVIVDDEALSLTNARNLLCDQNIRVSCLRSGRELLKFLEKNTPDMILLDIMMPDMDGFETYRAIREYEDGNEAANVPVIFMTGENDSEVERRGLKAGASDFIHKPFNKDILISRIKNTITNKKTIETLTEEAAIDKLTGFLNKASGTERIAKLCESETGALMVLDLDSFKLVNDLYGHDMGDRILMTFADVVRHNIRSDDVISRIGGDEFMGFFSDITEESAVASLTKRLNDQLVKESFRIMGDKYDIPLGISIGVVLIPGHGRNYETLFSMADHAMYTVKKNGKHGFVIYSQNIYNETYGEEDLEKELDGITMILEERSDSNGGFALGQEAFSVIYRFLARFHKRYGGNTTKILFALAGKTEEGGSLLNGAEKYFADVVQKTLRKCDVIMQSKPNRFCILLPETTRDEAAVMVSRIFEEWKRSEYQEVVDITSVIKTM